MHSNKLAPMKRQSSKRLHNPDFLSDGEYQGTKSSKSRRKGKSKSYENGVN